MLAMVLMVAAADPAAWVANAGGVIGRDGAGKLTTVDLRSSWVTDSDLPELLKIPSLTKLDLSMTRISDQGFQRLKDLPGITDLNLYYAEYITDEGMSAVKGWKKLQRVNLRGTKVTDTTLAYLGALTELEFVDVGFSQITDNGIEVLSALPKLKSLAIAGNKLTDVGLQAVRHMPVLESLDIEGPQRTDSGLWSVSLTESGIDAIGTAKTLRSLKMGGTSISGVGLEKLMGSLPNLSSLSLRRSKRVNDQSVDVLSKWSSLRWLDVQDTGITAEGAAKLRAALKGCEVLY